MSKIFSYLTRPGADGVANNTMRDVIGNKTDAAVSGIGTTNSLMGYIKRLCGAETSIEKTDGAVLAAKDPLFVVTGGPILVVEFVGVVTTLIGGAANMTINCSVTAPAADIALSTTVAVDNDAVGTTYTFTSVALPVLTPLTAGCLPLVPVTRWLVPIGTINALGSAAQAGVIAWYMSYKPLSPSSKVVVAA
jgi:hypothetical protein